MNLTLATTLWSRNIIIPILHIRILWGQGVQAVSESRQSGSTESTLLRTWDHSDAGKQTTVRCGETKAKDGWSGGPSGTAGLWQKRLRMSSFRDNAKRFKNHRSYIFGSLSITALWCQLIHHIRNHKLGYFHNYPHSWVERPSPRVRRPGLDPQGAT